ncbi:hypothetical protein D3C71_1584060 [compost metagenome]
MDQHCKPICDDLCSVVPSIPVASSSRDHGLELLPQQSDGHNALVIAVTILRTDFSPILRRGCLGGLGFKVGRKLDEVLLDTQAGPLRLLTEDAVELRQVGLVDDLSSRIFEIEVLLLLLREI